MFIPPLSWAVQCHSDWLLALLNDFCETSWCIPHWWSWASGNWQSSNRQTACYVEALSIISHVYGLWSFIKSRHISGHKRTLVWYVWYNWGAWRPGLSYLDPLPESTLPKSLAPSPFLEAPQISFDVALVYSFLVSKDVKHGGSRQNLRAVGFSYLRFIFKKGMRQELF